MRLHYIQLYCVVQNDVCTTIKTLAVIVRCVKEKSVDILNSLSA